MALARLCLLALAARAAAALPNSTSAAALPADARVPEWCKSETELTWAEKKARAAKEAKLQWAKKEVKELRAKNVTIPEWLGDIVAEDERNGQMKWAVLEAKNLKENGKEVPDWMAKLVKENERQTKRWAACTVAEMRRKGEDVPEWMAESGRQGILEAAAAKAQELQKQIDELTAQRDEESSKVDAGGDAKLATNLAMGRTLANRRMNLEQQGLVVDKTLHALKHSEMPVVPKWEKQKALRDAQAAARQLLKALQVQLQEAPN